jgi:hypothetical protein
MTKKIFATIGLVALAFIIGSPALLAQTPGQQPNLGLPVYGQTTSVTGWVNILITIVRWFYTIIFVVAVLFILLAAFHFITSKGDAATTTKAKQELLYAVIGIAVALLSYGIVTLITNSLTSGLSS